MIAFAIAFLLGDLLLQFFPALPEKSYVFLMVMIGFLFYILFKNKLWSNAVLGFFLGFAFTAWYASNILSWTLPKESEGKPILVTGFISSLPVKTKWQTQIEFDVNKLISETVTTYPKIKIKLSLRNFSHPIRVGDQWQFLVRLKRIHTTQNPGAFDFEAWALQKGLRATGYVLNSEKNYFISHDSYRYLIHQFRQQLQEKIEKNITPSPTSSWLIGLLIGERNNISKEDWQVLRNTGTNHLMVIAGLHIGIITGLMQWLVNRIWRRIPLAPLLFPAQQVALIISLFVALFYSALAGFSIPTERACIMLSLYIFISLFKHQINVWYVYALALFTVLLCNPLNILNVSFCLSFATIALIIYGMQGRLSPKGIWWKWGRVQWVIGFGLIPFSFLLFSECSLISFIANTITIPLLAIFVLPLCLLSIICLMIAPSFAKYILLLADKNLEIIWKILVFFSQFHYSSFAFAMPSIYLFLLSIFGFILLLCPYGFPGRWLGFVWLLPLFFYQTPKPIENEIWLSILDVGQGLSAIVQTKHHTLVFDTGAKYIKSDMGDSVIIPYLHVMHRMQIDKLILSHGDNDHIGGAFSLMKAIPIYSVETSVPEKIEHLIASEKIFRMNKNTRPKLCLAHDVWQWDGVTFEYLYPTINNLHLNNDSSCVLRISNGTNTILLTGDIEKYAEQQLMQSEINLLPATILIAPHHGSKTSADTRFVLAVHPKIVIYATGYRNRYHFPHQSVIKTYTDNNVVPFNTVDTGTIIFKMKKNEIMPRIEAYRINKKHYWFD